MNTHYTGPVAQEANRQAANLRRELNAVIRQAQTALESMDQGGRPSPYADGSIFNSSIETVQSSAAALNSLLNLAGSPVFPQEDAVSILKEAGK